MYGVLPALPPYKGNSSLGGQERPTGDERDCCACSPVLEWVWYHMGPRELRGGGKPKAGLQGREKVDSLRIPRQPIIIIVLVLLLTAVCCCN
jgi:hypothetical protein